MEDYFMESSSPHDDHHPSQTLVIKGKRTKRPKPASPGGVGVTSSSSSGGVGGENGGGGGGSDASSTQISTCTEEDEDMANCLILLAQSGKARQDVDDEEHEGEEEESTNKNIVEKFRSRKFTEMATSTTGSKAGFYVYECKTCNRTFPSFQALGGHRASHKKPKFMNLDDHQKKEKIGSNTVIAVSKDDHHHHQKRVDQDHVENGQLMINRLICPPSIQFANKANFHGNILNKPKIHECSICGSEFSSGQALGGHMRRHRAPNNSTSKVTVCLETSTTESSHDGSGERPRNVLALDLNLPAPVEDDHHGRETKFEFSPSQPHMVFAAPALVDCHY